MKQFFVKFWWMPVTVAAVIAAWQYKKYLDKMKALAFGTPIKAGNGSTPNVGTAAGCIFPLKVGSKNSCVQQLQIALGVTPDKIFGKKETLPALQKQTGKSQIDNESDLIATIAKINAAKSNTSAASSKQARTNQIFDSFNSNKSLQYILPTSNVTWKRVIKDGVSNAWIEDGWIVNFKKGMKLPLSDYQPRFTGEGTIIGNKGLDGDALIENNSIGQNNGFWKANPIDITLI